MVACHKPIPEVPFHAIIELHLDLLGVTDKFRRVIFQYYMITADYQKGDEISRHLA